MIQLVRGDILNAFDDGCDLICHQVNCKGKMGAGLAKDIANRWPEVKRDYVELCMEEIPENLLGTYLDTPVEVGRIISIFGQLCYGREPKRCYTDYSALEKAFRILSHVYAGRTIAFPYGFGCGLGGGDWKTISTLIDEHFTNCTVKLYYKEKTK